MSLAKGAKCKKSSKDRKIEKLKGQVDKLENCLEEKEERIRKLNEKLNPPEKEVKSVKCPYCGFEKVYKNSTYKRRPKGFFDKLKQDEQKEETVQGFLCPWCGKSFHMEEKGASSTLT